MGISGVRRSPGIPGEAKSKDDGMRRYDGSWPDKVTHLTQWPDLNHRVLYPVENIWSIIDEITYRDPAPKTLDRLKK